MAPIVRALAQIAGVEARVCVTAQHRQMLDQVLQVFEIHPHYDLNLMRENQTLPELSAEIFTHLNPALQDFKPDWVVAQGDTTTVAITSLLSYFNRVKFGHVEAGLRTHNKWQPFPEEINRRVAGVIADLHFAPTEFSRQNLLREGIHENNIRVTGNTVIDALQYVREQAEPEEITRRIQKIRAGRRIILVTAHRRENFGQSMVNICSALVDLSKREDLEIIYPVHLNPNVQEPVYRLLRGRENITLLPPLDYLPMIHLMKHAFLILTDSGGIQEEAPAFGIPTLVLRDVTERPEGVEAGILQLVGTDPQNIFNTAARLLDDPAAYAKMAKAVNPFGDGHASEKIVRALLEN